MKSASSPDTRAKFKMSDALLALCAEAARLHEMDFACMAPDKVRDLVAFGATAWNMSYASEEESEAELALFRCSAQGTLDEDELELCVALAREMIGIRKKSFRDHYYRILDLEIFDVTDVIKLRVVSTEIDAQR